MKFIFFFFCLFSFHSFAEVCPDVSGTYQQLISSCNGPYWRHRGWPLIDTDTTVTVTQDGCKSVTISYLDQRYTNNFTVNEVIDFAKATKFSFKKHTISATFKEKPVSIQDWSGHLNSMETMKIKMWLEGDKLMIDSTTSLFGLYDIVIPVVEMNHFKCELERKQ